MENIVITSTAFRYGDIIPMQHTCDGRDISPQLSWNIVPEARSYTLIMEDPDAPGGTFTHWTIYNIPSYIRILPEGIPKVPDLSAWPLTGNGFQGMTDFGTIGYRGPCPPPGKPEGTAKAVHRYFFRIYALDTILNLPPGASRRYIEKAMIGHTITKGELMGIYGR